MILLDLKITMGELMKNNYFQFFFIFLKTNEKYTAKLKEGSISLIRI